jgi:cytoskeletal protein RodZ
MRVKVIVLGLAAVLVVSGCGGKKAATATTSAVSTTASSGTSSSKSSASVSSSASSSASSSSSGSSASSSSKVTFASTKNCAQLASLAAKASQAFASSGANSKAALANEADVLKALSAAAPSEIRGDFTTFADAYVKFAAVFAKSGFTVGKTPTPAQIAALQNAAKTFQAPKLIQAEAHLNAWSRKNCGSPATTTP